MLKNDLIEPSNIPWSSPCVLVSKPGEEKDCYGFCTDLRKIIAVTKTDSYLIARMDDCINQIRDAKMDLLKGFWQVGLSDRAKEISAFVTMD